MLMRGYTFPPKHPFNPTGDKERFTETGYPVYKPDQRWYYQSFMKPDEVIIFTIAASDHSKAWHTPHSAFVDPEFENETKERENIETRVFVFWD